MTQTLEQSYDDLPYEGQAFLQTHPDRLATIARLHGVVTPNVEGARVLELGCGLAGNLGPMAMTLPGARFVGIDLSKRHVEMGNERLAAAGITNVELRHADLAHVGESLGEFDYIVAHGLYSWVPPEVAEALLALVRRSLTPNGVAYISYNVLPGWYGRSILRDLLMFHAESADGTAARVKRGREALAWLHEALPDGGRYAEPLVSELNSLTKESDWYLAHELLEVENNPLHFREMLARLTRHGLRYVDDASPEVTCEHATTPLAAKARALAGNDPMRAEQYFDFLHGRTFRRALVCRDTVEVTRNVPPDAVESLRVASRLRLATPDADLKRRTPVAFTAQRGDINSDHPLTKAALVHLASIAPLSLPFRELIAAAQERLGGGAPSDRDVELLRRFLARAFLSTGGFTVELRSSQPAATATAGERPVATTWARDEVKRHSWVTSMRHEGVHLDDTLRLLVPLLDGTRTKEQLQKDWSAGKGREFLPGAMDAALDMLSKNALLIR